MDVNIRHGLIKKINQLEQEILSNNKDINNVRVNLIQIIHDILNYYLSVDQDDDFYWEKINLYQSLCSISFNISRKKPAAFMLRYSLTLIKISLTPLNKRLPNNIKLQDIDELKINELIEMCFLLQKECKIL